MAEEIAHTGEAFPAPERLGNTTDVGREFVTVTSDGDCVCEEDMISSGVEIGSKDVMMVFCLATWRTCFAPGCR